jgi:hypothetical protein
LVTVLYAVREVPSRPAYRTVTNTEWHIPDVVLIQLTLLMMSTRLLETCRESKQIYIKGIVRQVGYLLELYRDARSPEYKKNEVISSWGQWITNAEETPCNMESVTCLLINSLTVMDIHFSYSIQKIKKNRLNIPSSTSPCIDNLSFLRIISIKWTIMEML